jgi:hypothetical protein
VAETGGGANFFQGSSLLFSNWPAIEIGVGLIACNLPSLSFRAVHTLPRALRRGMDLSWSGIRYAAGRFSLRSTSRRSPSDGRHTTGSAMDPAWQGEHPWGDSSRAGTNGKNRSSSEQDIALDEVPAQGEPTRRGGGEGYGNAHVQGGDAV